MQNLAPIPFTDIKAELAKHRPEIDVVIQRVLDSGQLLLGDELSAFEKEFAEYQNMPYAVGLASGLSALKLMLQAFDIGAGDEVIVPANTYIATWLAISHVGAVPVPVEPDFATRNIDPGRLPDALSARTRAVLVTHLYGMPCDMNALVTFCRDHDLWLLVDAAQSCGAEWEGDRAAGLGDAAAFSFYPTKNLATIGDAGAVVLFDAECAERIRQLRNYGMKDRYHHLFKGENARMDELHAAVLRVRLRYLDESNRRRREISGRYLELFAGLPELQCQAIQAGATPVWHLFTLNVPERDRMVEQLARQGIGTSIHYPVPPHRSKAYQDGSVWPELPITDRLARTVMSLPCYPSLDDESVDRVARAVMGEAGVEHA